MACHDPPSAQSRRPVDADAVTARLAGRWLVEAVAETGSTNADLLAAAATGAPAGTVLVAELQSGGRGRLGRSWVSPAGAGLTFSVLLRPAPPVPTWGWLPLLTGLALARTLGSAARLKWPNDVLLGARGRQGGRHPGAVRRRTAVVVGVGLNVSTGQAELPVRDGHLAAARGPPGAGPGRVAGRFPEPVRRPVHRLAGARRRRRRQRAGRRLPGRAARRWAARCRSSSAATPCSGRAVGVDGGGRLLVRPTGGGAPVPVAAGDVTHVRERKSSR